MFVGAVAWLVFTQPFQDSLAKPTRLTDNRTQIRIVLETEAEMFPKSWLESPINAKAKPLDTDQVDRSGSLVTKALDYYPAEVLKSALTKVYVCRSIEFYGLEYGGTNSLDCVYLTNAGEPKGYSDSYIVGSFHHELSSIFLRNHPENLEDKAWNDCNPEGFKYGQGGTEALRSGQDSTQMDETLAAKGFLAQYAQASLEEDFNMTVEGLFSGNARFWKLVDEHERFRSKARIAIKFYSKLDPVFTETHFRNLVKTGR